MGFVRKYLSADGLVKTVKHCFLREKFKGYENSPYSWSDCLMSGLAIFGFKMPSLLQFEKKKVEDVLIKRNLKTLYGVDKPPSDTTLRERLDQLSPKQLRRAFKKIFAYLQRGKVLEKFRYLDGHHIVSLDGTGQFSSETIHCANCCEKKHRGGNTTYYHQMLGAVLVHPDLREVIPLAPEHNYGHGNENLCSVMTMLMMLAFLIDQVQQLCCKVYQDARKKVGRLSALFEDVRSLMKFSLWESWEKLYRYIAYIDERGPPLVNGLAQII